MKSSNSGIVRTYELPYENDLVAKKYYERVSGGQVAKRYVMYCCGIVVTSHKWFNPLIGTMGDYHTPA